MNWYITIISGFILVLSYMFLIIWKRNNPIGYSVAHVQDDFKIILATWLIVLSFVIGFISLTISLWNLVEI